MGRSVAQRIVSYRDAFPISTQEAGSGEESSTTSRSTSPSASAIDVLDDLADGLLPNVRLVRSLETSPKDSAGFRESLVARDGVDVATSVYQPEYCDGAHLINESNPIQVIDAVTSIIGSPHTICYRFWTVSRG